MPDQPRRLLLREIHEVIGGELAGAPETVITGISNLEDAGPTDLAYIAADRHLPAALSSHAAAFVTHRPLPDLRQPQIVVPHPAYAFARLAERFFTAPYRARGVADLVVRGAEVRIGPEPSIWPFVTLGDRVVLGARVTLFPGVFVGEDVTIGDDSVLYPNVSVMDRCRIGARVRIHSGTVVGSDGFGYVQQGGRNHKVPQLGIVVIEDDVELGANVTVDRATFGHTLIKRGTKVDNLVQIAHNVTVGEDSILVAQAGIAGSSTLGHHVVMGGQAGVGDHLRIGDLATVAARSGVAHHIEGGQVVSGNPAIPHTVSLRALTVIPRLPELRRQVRDLEHRIRALEAKPRTRRLKAQGKRQK
jgi:UDP-3-O-[3-hydroxymyristoyl] glucosamine N-acyltransferase